MREHRKLIVDRHRDHRKTVFVAGVGRNSTALVCVASNDDNRYRTLCEPFSDLSGPSSDLANRLLARDTLRRAIEARHPSHERPLASSRAAGGSAEKTFNVSPANA